MVLGRRVSGRTRKRSHFYVRLANRFPRPYPYGGVQLGGGVGGINPGLEQYQDGAACRVLDGPKAK